MKLHQALKALKTAQSLNDGLNYYMAIDFYTKKYRIETRSNEELKAAIVDGGNQTVVDFVKNYDIKKDLH